MTSVAYGIAMPVSRGVLGRPLPLLLDLISAAPTAAFATWKLRNLYAGACIRVRRASDNAEQDIGFSGNLLDTTALLAWCGSGDGFVTKFYDQTTNARNLSQATAANQPKIVSSGALIADINGQPSIQFNGSSHVLSGAALSNFVIATNYGVMALARPTSGLASAPQGWTAAGVIGDALGYIWHSYETTRWAGGHWRATGGNIEVGVNTSFPSTHVSIQSYDGANIKGWLDGGAATMAATAGGIGNLTGALYIGRSTSSAYFTGTIAGTLLFNAAPSLADINTVGADWSERGGVTWSTAA
jgi:hypothetical protein